MKLIDRLKIFVLLLALLPVVSGCEDDLDYNVGVIDGSTRDVMVDLAFEPEEEVDLQSRAGFEPGNSISGIDDLRILVYNDLDVLVYNHHLVRSGNTMTSKSPEIKNITYTASADNRIEEDVNPDTNEPSGDDATGHVTFTLSIPTGHYKIYAVANTPDLPDGTTGVDVISSPHKLKSIRRKWVTDKNTKAPVLSSNSEMFGIFTVNIPDRKATDDKTIAVTTSTFKLHSWLRRLASKVTVAFDGKDLYDNVQVFIESVTLYDIPVDCSLGYPNVPGLQDPASVTDYKWLTDETVKAPAMAAATSRYTVSNGLIQEGGYHQIQKFKPGVPMSSEEYLHVCNKRHPYLGMGSDNANSNDENIISSAHANTSRAFFFYENMQGVGKDKAQSADGSTITFPNPEDNKPDTGWKDGKSYGTYVEVKGFYRCTSADKHVSDGNIIYRFMLGKDVERDYNSERNRHYQLTLRFKGYGNDADWHIVYEHDRGIEVQSPLYISYDYNKKMMATVRVSGEIPSGCYLRARVKDCDWRPWGAADSKQFLPPSQSDYSPKSWDEKDGRHNGFLSCRTTKVLKIEKEGWENRPSNTYGLDESWQLNIDHYKDTKRGWRCFNVTPSESGYDSNDADGMYFVTNISPSSSTKVTERLFTIPFYTRAKELVTRTGFTGNNPWTQYPRSATVVLEIVRGDAEDAQVVSSFKPVELQIIQVRRVINPVGVWRKNGSTEPFHVTLMRQPETDADFKPFNSEGKWYAEVLSGETSGVITLSSTVEGSGSDNRNQTFVNRIEGEAEHPVDFKINFTGKVGSAVVRVRYHNYTCEHDIFCRNGYDPVDVSGKGNYWWPSYNVDHFKNGNPVYTKSPLQQGSFFRYGNYTAILASNDRKFGFNQSPTGDFDVINPDGTTGTSSWSNIKAVRYPVSGNNNLSVWPINTSNGKEDTSEKIAGGEAFYELISPKANSLTFNVKKAYGIVYGDGATETLTSHHDAWGYDRTDGAPDQRGMRGVIVYNSETLRMLFLPVGMTGYGHRQTNTSGGLDGTLRYAGRSAPMKLSGDLLEKRPMFYLLYQMPGAIYWMNHLYTTVPNYVNDKGQKQDYIDSSKSSAFDINFETMGFEGYGGNDAMPNAKVENSHACFIRTVRTSEGKSPRDPH